MTFEQARATLYRRYIKSIAVVHVLFTLSQMLLGICALLFGRSLLKMGDQYAEVKTMHLEGNQVLCLFQIIA